MKKILFVCMMSLIWGLAVVVSEAEAQYAYWYTDVRYVPASRFVDGYSTTYLDYYAGLNYDPAVFAELCRADIDESPLDWGYDVGYADVIDAEVYLFTTNYVKGKTYCTSGVHSYIHYLTGQQTVFRRVFPCITIPFPPPSPTPPPPPPTPTPTPTPTPSPTPCPQNDLGGFCQIRIISVHITPQTLKPVGTDGGNNTATVSGCLRTGNNMPLPDRQINLKVYRHLANSDTGGHVDLAHTGSRPVGRLERTSGTTGSDGCFTSKYHPSHIGGIVTIEAFVDSGFYEHKNVLVAVPNLVSLPPGENYGLIGASDAHPSNHWGAPAAVNGLVQIANDYKARFYSDNPIPDNARLHYNDISLQFGGKFELAATWNNKGAHAEHREGINTDVRCCRDPGNVPRSRWTILWQIFIDRGSTETLDETRTANPHWHLRFLFGAPHRRAEKTPHSFVLDNLPKFQEAGWMSPATAEIYASILKREDLAGALRQAKKDLENEFITGEFFFIIEGLNQ